MIEDSELTDEELFMLLGLIGLENVSPRFLTDEKILWELKKISVKLIKMIADNQRKI